MRAGVALASILLALCGLSADALAGGDANRASCENEAASSFKRYLLDCRAYEMVTPPYKNGYPVILHGVRAGEYSGGAPLVTGASLGSFAGGFDQVDSVRGADYAFVREAAGWTTRPLDPSPAEHVVNPLPARREGEAIAVSEGGAAVLMLHTPAESIYGSELYLRSPQGVYSTIGPAVSSAALPSEPVGLANANNHVRFAGASQDLSHVLYYLEPSQNGLRAGATTNLWPGDTTTESTGLPDTGGTPTSLYEYTGTGHEEPALVAVDSEHRLLGQCGVTLGGPVTAEEEGVPEDTGNARDAVSATGQTVFVTVSPQCPGSGNAPPGYGPPAYELYARIDGQRTEAVSEPSPEECQGQCAGVPIGDASFQGASQDGSKVFFLSTQKLLPAASEDNGTHLNSEGGEVADSAVLNGGCQAASAGGGCNLYEYDLSASAGHRLTLVSGGSGGGAFVQGVAAVSDDGSHVYFVARAKLTGANSEGVEPGEGEENLYAFDNGQLTFIATLSEAEADARQWALEGSAPMNVTPDGHVLVFESQAALTRGVEGGSSQIYRYTADEPRSQKPLLDVSAGSEAVGASIPHPHFNGAEVVGAGSHPAVSSSGETVVFTSSAALAPETGGTPGARYIYEWEHGQVGLVSAPRVTAVPPHLLGIDASGADIFFETVGSLVPRDTDTLVDLYDARANGGFTEPASVATCNGGCLAPENPVPKLPDPGTATRAPGDNQPPGLAIKSKPLTRAQKLARALRACHGKPRKRRRFCEAAARRRYGRKPAKRPK
jgi:hypothetical protein